MPMTHAHNQTILLAEDDGNAREITAMVLEAEGYRVLTSSNGSAALDILLHDVSIDLLLSDINMPGGIDGIELAQRARKHRPMPIMLISGNPRASFEHFPDDVTFLPKPYDRRGLLGAVNGALHTTAM